jgi:hypothetical protein
MSTNAAIPQAAPTEIQDIGLSPFVYGGIYCIRF